MTTDLAPVQQIPSPLELSGRDREAAQAVADGIRDAKAENTRRSYASAWRRFQAWAEDGGHLAATGRSMATIEQARSRALPFPCRRRHTEGRQSRPSSGCRRGREGLAQPGPVPPAVRCPHLRCSGARVREVLRLPRRGRGRRMESPGTAHKRAALDPAIIGVLADGGFRRPEAAALTWSDVEL